MHLLEENLGELCGACFESGGECRCASFELGRPVDEAPAIAAAMPAVIAGEDALAQLAVMEDPDLRPYVWDLEELCP